jgi:hypothetical protein
MKGLQIPSDDQDRYLLSKYLQIIGDVTVLSIPLITEQVVMIEKAYKQEGIDPDLIKKAVASTEAWLGTALEKFTHLRDMMIEALEQDCEEILEQEKSMYKQQDVELRDVGKPYHDIVAQLAKKEKMVVDDICATFNPQIERIESLKSRIKQAVQGKS